MAKCQGAAKIRSKTTRRSAPPAGFERGEGRLKNEKYYEQTQHLIENKESGFENPATISKISWLSRPTQQTSDNELVVSERQDRIWTISSQKVTGPTAAVVGRERTQMQWSGGRWVCDPRARSDNRRPPSNFFKLNFLRLSRNVVENKRSQIAIMRLPRNVYESKAVNPCLPGMFMINKVVSHFSEAR
jgi:hypothetical protein